VKKAAEDKAQMKFEVYEAIKYRTKGVAKIDFNIIVRKQNNECITDHVMAYSRKNIQLIL